uniref:FHA domain-containing protein n=1 Tax=Haemonchus contortus TaxID=6289 RepID=A0A7I4Y712_HAECO
MLRRYSSQNLETIPMQSKVITIGTTGKCDIKLNAKGVHPVHASIEQNPSSGTFWLKDHSLAGRTTVNGHYVHGEVELHNGDLVRIGRAQPFVFEKRSLIPLNGNSVIDDAPVEKDMSKSAMFPVLGTKKQLSTKPSSKSGVDRPTTALIKSKRTAANAADKKPPRDNREETRRPSPSSSIESNSLTSLSTVSSGLRLTPHTRGSVGNHLLQRVVRLQDELTRKNQEIDQLRRQKSYPEAVSPPTKAHPYYLPFLQEMPSAGGTPIGRNFELETYRAFLGTVAAKIRSFNDYILRGRQSDFSDVFLAFINMTKEPISQKMIEIERECDIELERKGFTALQRSHLPELFRNDRKANISKVATEIEHLVPVIREACSTAGESIRVCSVFTQWSRHLGDQIRIEGLTGTQLMNAIEELKEDFYRNRMEDHWLLPSISPLLSLTAHELEKSRESSSIGEIQAGDSSMSSGGEKTIFKTATDVSAENSSRTVQNEQSEKEDKNEENDFEVGKHNDAPEDSVDKLLAEAEIKSAQLESQLSVLQRKISESKDVSESTRIRLSQLLRRLNSSASSIQRVSRGADYAEEEPTHKQSINSIMSFQVTEDDIQHARKLSSGEEVDSTDRRSLHDESKLDKGNLDLHQIHSNENGNAYHDEGDNDSHFSYEADLDDELYQLYCDSSKYLGWPTKLLVQFSQNCAVVVNKDLLLDVINCSRSMLNQKVNRASENRENPPSPGSDGPQEIDVHEVHSQQVEMLEGANQEAEKPSEIKNQGEDETEPKVDRNSYVDKVEVDQNPHVSDGNNNDVEETFELKHTVAQQAANVRSCPPSEEGGRDGSSDSGATSTENVEQDKGNGDEVENKSEADGHSEPVPESGRQSPEQSAGSPEETGQVVNEAQAEVGAVTPSKSMTPVEQVDQKPDDAGTKSGEGTPSPSTPTPEETGTNPDNTDEKNEQEASSLNSPTEKETDRSKDETEVEGKDGTPSQSSPTAEQADQNAGGTEKKNEEEAPSQSIMAVSETAQKDNEAEVPNDENAGSQAISISPIKMNGDLPSRSDSITTTNSDIQSVPKTNISKVTPEMIYEVGHKYHIKSHINTATRTPVVVQAVPVPRNLFRSPTTTRKFAPEDLAEKDVKPVLLQPRFVH